MVFGWLAGLAGKALGAMAPALIESGKNALIYGAMKLGGAGLKWIAPKIQKAVGSGFQWLARKTGLISPEKAGEIGENLVQRGTGMIEGKMEEVSKRKREEALAGALNYVDSNLKKLPSSRGGMPSQSSGNQAEKILQEGENTLKQKRVRLEQPTVD